MPQIGSVSVIPSFLECPHPQHSLDVSLVIGILLSFFGFGTSARASNHLNLIVVYERQEDLVMTQSGLCLKTIGEPWHYKPDHNNQAPERPAATAGPPEM
jgi:hypothetical protein